MTSASATTSLRRVDELERFYYVTEQVLRQLVDHGESLYVERKVEPPKAPGFGAAGGLLREHA